MELANSLLWSPFLIPAVQFVFFPDWIWPQLILTSKQEMSYVRYGRNQIVPASRLSGVSITDSLFGSSLQDTWFCASSSRVSLSDAVNSSSSSFCIHAWYLQQQTKSKFQKHSSLFQNFPFLIAKKDATKGLLAIVVFRHLLRNVGSSVRN